MSVVPRVVKHAQTPETRSRLWRALNGKLRTRLDHRYHCSCEPLYILQADSWCRLSHELWHIHRLLKLDRVCEGRLMESCKLSICTVICLEISGNWHTPDTAPLNRFNNSSRILNRKLFLNCQVSCNFRADSQRSERKKEEKKKEEKVRTHKGSTDWSKQTQPSVQFFCSTAERIRCTGIWCSSFYTASHPLWSSEFIMHFILAGDHVH